MSRSQIERRLSELGERLRLLRDELRVVDEQLSALTDEADEAEVRALVSDSALDARDHRDARRHAEAMGRRRVEIVAEVARLEVDQDDLLDRLVAEGR